MAVGVAYVMEQCTSRTSLEVSEKKRREGGHNIQSSADQPSEEQLTSRAEKLPSLKTLQNLPMNKVHV